MGNENSQPEYNTNNRCDSAKHRDPMGFMDFILPQDAINKRNEAFHRPTGEDHSRPKNDIFSVCGATQAANVPPTATPTKFGFAKLPGGEKRKQRQSNRPALPDEAVDVVGRGDLKELRRMITDGTVPHVDAYDKKGRTMLHLSVMHGNLAMVQLLCSCKADVLCKSVDDSSVLTVAEDCSRKTVARFLGLWAHVAACGPSTALHLTALQGNTIDMQHILRDTKVDIDYEETYGHHTALHLAVKGGQFECVKILVRAGADPNRRHRLSAESALISAVIQHDALLVKFLLSQGAIAQTQYSGKTLMQWAIDNKRSSKVLDLLRESASHEYFEENENDIAGDRDGGTRGRGGVARGEGIVHRGGHEMSQGQLGQEQHSQSYLEDQAHIQRQLEHQQEVMLRRRPPEATATAPGSVDAHQSLASGNVQERGKCGLCGELVLTNQPRISEKGIYYHQDCFTRNDNKLAHQRRSPDTFEECMSHPPTAPYAFDSDTPGDPLPTARGPTQRSETGSQVASSPKLLVHSSPKMSGPKVLEIRRTPSNKPNGQNPLAVPLPMKTPQSVPDGRADVRLPLEAGEQIEGGGRREGRGADGGWGETAGSHTATPRKNKNKIPSPSPTDGAITIAVSSSPLEKECKSQLAQAPPDSFSASPPIPASFDAHQAFPQDDIDKCRYEQEVSGDLAATSFEGSSVDVVHKQMKRVSVAAFDYDAEMEDEMSFTAGARFVIVGDSEDDGWVKAILLNTGQQGLVPVTHLEKY